MNGFYTYGNRFGSASTYSNTSSFGSLADLGNDNGVDDLGNISVVVRWVYGFKHFSCYEWFAIISFIDLIES